MAQNAREPLLVVSELLYTMLNLRLKLADRDLRDSEELNNFTAAAAELQVCFDWIGRVGLGWGGAA
jgi:hypothetical protein